MSLLTVAAAVFEEIGLDAPSGVVSSQDLAVKQLLRLINRAGRVLATKNWTVLQREYLFQTEATVESYPLPTDFARLLDVTGWDRTSYAALRGPRSPKEWQAAKSSLVGALTPRFRIKADNRVNKFFIDPVPTAAEDIVFEYASSQWVRNDLNSEGRLLYASDTDVSLIDEQLIELEGIWRLLNRKGFAYAEEKREAEQQIDIAFAEDGGAAVLNLGVGSSGGPLGRINIPEGNFGL